MTHSLNLTPCIIQNATPCPLTGLERTLYQEGERMSFFYDTPETGRVWYSDMVAMGYFPNLTDYQKTELAALCLTRKENNLTPIFLDSAFMKQHFPIAAEF